MTLRFPTVPMMYLVRQAHSSGARRHEQAAAQGPCARMFQRFGRDALMRLKRPV
jgi:hypothetical protein